MAAALSKRNSLVGKKPYEVITDRILDRLRQGVIPWRQSWRSGPSNPPMNISGRPYRGINPFILNTMGFSSPYWITFREAKRRGGHIRAGEKGVPVVFWKILSRKVEDRDGDVEEKNIPLLRYYTVFNEAQVEGVEFPKRDVVSEFDPIGSCEAIIEKMPQRPEIRHGGDKACYIPALDIIKMPLKEQFVSAQSYYSVLFHEATHSTLHSTRLNRRTGDDDFKFGSHAYSKEELVAEMGSAFLCGHAGIEQDTLENSAAYISSWLSKLEGDPKFVIFAAAQAQRAADFILGPQASETEDDDAVAAEGSTSSSSPFTEREPADQTS
jgi:antirestriction protein ArdC